MIWNKLRIGSVTNHVALKDVSTMITKELVLNKLEVFHKTLQKDFNIPYPRLAVMGLNPHSGDNGLYGREDIDNKIISINQQESSKLLLLSNNFSVRHNLQKNGVKNVNHISSDKLEFLWNNDFIYYTKDGEELDNIRFFIL